MLFFIGLFREQPRFPLDDDDGEEPQEKNEAAEHEEQKLRMEL
jgi:hypothetical protein